MTPILIGNKYENQGNDYIGDEARDYQAKPGD